jgi:hypothetical protein
MVTDVAFSDEMITIGGGGPIETCTDIVHVIAMCVHYYCGFRYVCVHIIMVHTRTYTHTLDLEPGKKGHPLGCYTRTRTHTHNMIFATASSSSLKLNLRGIAYVLVWLVWFVLTILQSDFAMTASCKILYN